MELFSARDLSLIERLVYQPNLKPSYDPGRNCLIWEDEYDFDLTPPGWEMIHDMLFARSFVQLNTDFNTLSVGSYYKNIWESAVKSNLKWNGFKRLVLSADDMEYFKKSRKEASDNTDCL